MKKNLGINPSTVLKALSIMLFITMYVCHTPEKKQENPSIQEKNKSTTDDDLVKNQKDILCFGNSLTEGYGLKSSEAYPALLQERIDSLGYAYNVVNAGISGETTAGGKGRIAWVLNDKVAVFLLELGANDGLRGIPLEETEKNLQSIIDTVKRKLPYAKIVLAGMQIPPNLGIDYTNDFKALYPKLAKKNNLSLIPFLLEGVAGIPELNQKDGIHPTAEATKQVLENVWSTLNPLLDKP